jgi:hypothetical protein
MMEVMGAKHRDVGKGEVARHPKPELGRRRRQQHQAMRAMQAMQRMRNSDGELLTSCLLGSCHTE